MEITRGSLGYKRFYRLTKVLGKVIDKTSPRSIDVVNKLNITKILKSKIGKSDLKFRKRVLGGLGDRIKNFYNSEKGKQLRNKRLSK